MYNDQLNLNLSQIYVFGRFPGVISKFELVKYKFPN